MSLSLNPWNVSVLMSSATQASSPTPSEQALTAAVEIVESLRKSGPNFRNLYSPEGDANQNLRLFGSAVKILFVLSLDAKQPESSRERASAILATLRQALDIQLLPAAYTKVFLEQVLAPVAPELSEQVVQGEMTILKQGPQKALLQQWQDLKQKNYEMTTQESKNLQSEMLTTAKLRDQYLPIPLEWPWSYASEWPWTFRAFFTDDGRHFFSQIYNGESLETKARARTFAEYQKQYDHLKEVQVNIDISKDQRESALEDLLTATSNKNLVDLVFFQNGGDIQTLALKLYCNSTEKACPNPYYQSLKSLLLLHWLLKNDEIAPISTSESSEIEHSISALEATFQKVFPYQFEQKRWGAIKISLTPEGVLTPVGELSSQELQERTRYGLYLLLRLAQTGNSPQSRVAKRFLRMLAAPKLFANNPVLAESFQKFRDRLVFLRNLSPEILASEAIQAEINFLAILEPLFPKSPILPEAPVLENDIEIVEESSSPLPFLPTDSTGSEAPTPFLPVAPVKVPAPKKTPKPRKKPKKIDFTLNVKNFLKR